jgi:threonine synthase
VKLYSTTNRETTYTLEQAVLQGIAPDGGLFMPTEIPYMPDSFFDNLHNQTFQDICYQVSTQLLIDSIPEEALHKIIDDAITFPAPLIQLEEHIHVLELWHGPSLAFKDFGAQFMARVMAYFNRNADQNLHILVATSGDTGGAVAAGFYQVPGIEVIILFPKGKVSHVQEKQLTTFGDNVQAIEIAGTFDDCQTLVKTAFNDPQLKSHLRLTSANSINIARLIPQMFYYFEAVRQLPENHGNIAISVPSGNFGNLTAGLFARKMGLPVTKFIAATNINDVVPQYLHTGVFHPRPSKGTLSNAMDVGNPSNFTRILELYSSTWNKIQSEISGFSFTDPQTLDAIREIFKHYHYIIDPHGAIGYLGLRHFLKNHHHYTGIFLETAHPSKFKSTIDQALNIDLPLHPSLQAIYEKPSSKLSLSKNYQDLFTFLIQTYAV